jgi:hypothetical protein
MADDKRQGKAMDGKQQNGIFGSLRDALKAASRFDSSVDQTTDRTPKGGVMVVPQAAAHGGQAVARVPVPVALDVVRDAKASLPRDLVQDATTRIVRGAAAVAAPARTTLVRGRAPVERGAFHQDPVVGWLVVVGGAGLGAFRPIFEGNNTLGRGKTNRIAVDFGDDSISADEQAYIRYDSTDHSFLFVPNLSKTNVVSVNDKKPTGAVPLVAMDVITVGRTQLAFVPFCGEEFDWSEITEEKA